MHVVNDRANLQAALTEIPGDANFVPTMGALHDGHLSLVKHAKALPGPCVVSIFVNPTQFAPSEDLATYPRTLESDLQKLDAVGTDIVFVPSEHEIYPEGIEHARGAGDDLELPKVAMHPGLEDGERPHFFRGVCLVVGRLLDLVEPSTCVMGEKDYQQLLVLQAMVESNRNRFAEVDVIGRPTVREADGLAMSSRNAYLDQHTRPRALALFRALEQAQREDSIEQATKAMTRILEEHRLDIDYAVVRDATTLEPPPGEDAYTNQSMRALIAARLEGVRLIDNAPWGSPEATNPS